MRLEAQERQREAERQHELDKLKKGSRNRVNAQPDNRFIAHREVRLVPPIDKVEVDKYFQHFETVAESLSWPKNCWSIMIQSVIKGKAQKAYSARSVTEVTDYDTVKKAIVTAYELVP